MLLERWPIRYVCFGGGFGLRWIQSAAQRFGIGVLELLGQVFYDFSFTFSPQAGQPKILADILRPIRHGPALRRDSPSGRIHPRCHAARRDICGRPVSGGRTAAGAPRLFPPSDLRSDLDLPADREWDRASRCEN